MNIYTTARYIALFLIVSLAIVTLIIYNNYPFFSFEIITNIPSYQTALAIPNIQTNNNNASNNFTKYENSTYAISIQYPSNWSIEELDLYSNDRVIPIVTFYSPLETYTDQYRENLSINLDNISYQADLEEYLQEALHIYRNNTNFKALELSTSSNLAGIPAYSLIYSWTTQNPEGQHNYNLKTMEIAAITENNKGYYIDYHAEAEKYDTYLPIIQKMIDSLVIDTSASPSQQDSAQLSASLQDDQSEDFLQYENTDLGINIQFPSNWEQREGTTTADFTNIGFVSPFESDTDKFPEMLWIAVENLDYTNVNLDGELDKDINSLKSDHPNIELIESNTNGILAGNLAYKFVFTYTEGVEFGNCRDVCDLKGISTGTIVDNKRYWIGYYGEAAKYDTYLPIIQKMIDSFEIVNK